MTALAQAAPLDQVCMGAPSGSQVPVAAAKAIYMGAMVALLTASGYATDPDAATTGAVLGVAQANADNTAVGASNGDVSVNILEGLFWRPADGTHPPVITDVGKVVYASDNYTISNDSSDGPVAGVLYGIDPVLGCLVYISGENNYLLSQSTLGSDLAATTAGHGGNLVGYDDSGNKTTAATVADALDEIYVDLKSSIAKIPLPIFAFVDASDGTALAAYAADDAGTVGFWSDGTKALGLRWNNTGGTTKTVGTTFKVPEDCDLTVAPVIKIKAAKTGNTLGDATTFVCGMYSQAEGAAYDAGANLGATSGGMTGNAAAKTVQLVSATLTVFPAVAAGMSLTINPTAAKLGTDDVIIFDAWIEYTRKLRTS